MLFAMFHVPKLSPNVPELQDISRTWDLARLVMFGVVV
jgi:hypothetical protein